MAAARLVLTPEADQDIEEAYWWYENQRLGLGEEFFRSLEAALDIIRNLPELRALVNRKYRRAPLRRFPYCVFYKFDGATVIVEYLSHPARDPAKWRAASLKIQSYFGAPGLLPTRTMRFPSKLKSTR